MKGYGGRLLFVDLTTGRARVESLDDSTARALLGGNGLAARVLYDHVPAGIDAFDASNAVVFGVGPITDTTVPGNSRACVAAKSPLRAYVEVAAQLDPNGGKHQGVDVSVREINLAAAHAFLKSGGK